MRLDFRMKPCSEKNKAGKKIWRVSYHIQGRRFRRTFRTHKDAALWAQVNRGVGYREGKEFQRMWLTISDEERRELLDALKLMRTLREKHQDSTLSLIMAASTQIALNERIESSLRLQDGAVLYLDDQTKRMPKGSVSQDGLNVLKPCLLRMARELPDKTVTEFSSDEIEEYLDDQDWSPRTFNNIRWGIVAVRLSRHDGDAGEIFRGWGRRNLPFQAWSVPRVWTGYSSKERGPTQIGERKKIAKAEKRQAAG